MIYIAQPYSHPSPEVRQQRYKYAIAATAYIMMHEGQHTPYSPIVAFHEVAIRFNLPKDFPYWMEHNFRVLAKCDKLYALMLEGYEDSKGMGVEMAYARSAGIPITYLYPLTLDDFIAEANQHS